MPDTLTRIDVEDLSVHYGQCHAVRRIGFSVIGGEIVGLLGRNGAGKSTCINAIAGLLPVSGGSVTVNGRTLTSAQPVDVCRAGVGLVPQGRRIFKSLTVDENLAVARRSGDGTARWTSQTIFELFPRLKERRRSMGRTLSGGEQQMLAIGRALMGNPRVLLLDEPSEGLAPQIVAEVASCIRQLGATGLAVLLVEQNLKMAERLAARVVVVSTGQGVYSGSTEDFLSNPAQVEVHLGVRHSTEQQSEAA